VDYKFGGLFRAKYLGNTDTLVDWMWIWFIWHRIHQCNVVVNTTLHIDVCKIVLNSQEQKA